MVTLYTIDCGKCKILEKKLNDAGITYFVCRDRDLMKSKGFDFMPVLEVDGKYMNFAEAVKWVNERGINDED